MRLPTLRTTILLSLIAIVACAPSGDSTGASAGMRETDLDILRDKVRGGWAGQMIGVSYGAPTEFRYLETLIPQTDLPEWTPEMVRGEPYGESTGAQVVIEDRVIFR